MLKVLSYADDSTIYGNSLFYDQQARARLYFAVKNLSLTVNLKKIEAIKFGRYAIVAASNTL